MSWRIATPIAMKYAWHDNYMDRSRGSSGFLPERTRESADRDAGYEVDEGSSTYAKNIRDDIAFTVRARISGVRAKHHRFHGGTCSRPAGIRSSERHGHGDGIGKESRDQHEIHRAGRIQSGGSSARKLHHQGGGARI